MSDLPTAGILVTRRPGAGFLRAGVGTRSGRFGRDAATAVPAIFPLHAAHADRNSPARQGVRLSLARRTGADFLRPGVDMPSPKVWRGWPERVLLQQQLRPFRPPTRKGQHASAFEFAIDAGRPRDDDLRNEKGRTTVAKAGLYALCFVILFGVLLIGAGFVIWDTVHDQPEPLPASVS